jgi:bifunctional non-homologous end joining protein LigD
LATRLPPRIPAAAVLADLPATLEPELAVLAARPPPGEWLYEIKFDGYRMLSRIEGAQVRLITRNGNDWTSKLRHLHDELLRLQLPPGWYDGEIVVLGPTGVPDFNALQNAFDRRRASTIEYFLFDAPFLAGRDMRRVALEDRRAAVKAVLGPSALVHFSEEFNATAGDLLASARKMGLEGIMGKRRGSPYVSSRAADWIKLKCTLSQDLVIGGYTPDTSGAGVGALLVGYFDESNRLQYAGKVGTGFSDVMLARLRRQLGVLRQATSPFATQTGHDRRANWVRPELVCEVAYVEWPKGLHLRHASFKGLRQDKAAAMVRLETTSAM